MKGLTTFEKNVYETGWCRGFAIGTTFGLVATCIIIHYLQ